MLAALRISICGFSLYQILPFMGSLSYFPKICGFHGTYVRTLRLSVDPCTVSVWKGGGNLFSRNTCPSGLPLLSHHRSDKQVKIKGGDRLQKRGKEIPLVSWPTFQLQGVPDFHSFKVRVIQSFTVFLIFQFPANSWYSPLIPGFLKLQKLLLKTAHFLLNLVQ